MIACTPARFIEALGLETSCFDHHWTGPPSAWQAENEGSVAHIEGQILYGLARKFGGPVLEVGSDLGVSTRYIHEGLEAHDSGHVYAVDPLHKWDDDPAWPRRRRIVGSGADYRPPEPCRWAFIDGDHRLQGVLDDISNAYIHGIDRMIFHDTAKRFESAARPTNTSNGSDAREAVLEYFDATYLLVDILSPCGLIYVERLCT